MTARDPRDIIRENYARRAERRAPEGGSRSTPCCDDTVLGRAVDTASSLAVGYTREQLEAEACCG